MQKNHIILAGIGRVRNYAFNGTCQISIYTLQNDKIKKIRFISYLF